jgi:O-antigen/teichoic acid export membrane protein
MGLGLVGALALWGASSLIGQLFDSTLLSRGTLYLSPGIFFFVTNKVLIYMLNGQRQMKLFALASGARAVGILIIVLTVVFRYPDYENFGLAFTLTEIAILLLVLSWRPLSLQVDRALIKVWMRRHLNFGAKSFVHSMVSEAFIRVDVLMLGLFVSDKVVGIYSFAAFFAEGIYQLPVVVRNMNNPILVKMLIEKNADLFVSFTRRTAMLSLGMTLVVAGATAVIYPWLDLVFDPETIKDSTVVLWVLLAGMVVYSVSVPFDFLFLIGGRPGVPSLFMLGNVSVNILLNAV